MMKILFVFSCLFVLPVFLPAQDLAYYVDQAKINSPLINKNKNDSKLLMLDLAQVKSILSKPQINVESSILFAPIISHDNNSNRFEWVSKGATSYSGYDLAFSDGSQYQAVVSVKQPVFTKNIYRVLADKNKISNQINSNNIELTRHELEKLVSYQYILCLKAKNQGKIAYSLLQELKTKLDLMEKLVENAIYKQSDLLLLQIEFENYSNQYIGFQGEYRNNLSDLNLLCGIEDTNLIYIPDTNFSLNPNEITDSRFLNRYKLDSLNIQAGQIIYEQKYKPRINIFADAGLNAVYLPALNRLGFSTGIGLIWNIYDGHQKEIEREKTSIKLQTLEFERQNFIKQYELNKHKYLNQIDLLNQRISVTGNQLAQYRELLDLYDSKLKNALISVMDLKNLLKDIASKKQENLLLNMEKQVLINAYNYWNY